MGEGEGEYMGEGEDMGEHLRLEKEKVKPWEKEKVKTWEKERDCFEGGGADDGLVVIPVLHRVLC